MKKITGLFYYLKKFIEKNYTNNVTKKAYKKYAKRFVAFIKNEGITAREVYSEPLLFIQNYTYRLVREGKRPNTVHTYIAPICKALGVKMNEVNKPIRYSTVIKKGAPQTNPQGKRERTSLQNRKTVAFADMVAIRRTEMKRLRKNDLIYDESGYLCVNVVKGKGGKPQMQRILPWYADEVKEYFDGTEDKMFTESEMYNKIDYHLGRRKISREAYDFYNKMCQTEKGREKLQKELILRFCENNIRYVRAKETGNIKEMARQIKLFKRNMRGDYVLRGVVRKTAIEKNMPVRYGKLPMMAVSVFHLSHWRNDVTIQHYILGWQ